MRSYKSSVFSENFTQCPCQNDNHYDNCCKPYHMGLAAPDAESLMRSRYTAFHLGLEQYLLETWHPDTRPVKINLSEEPKIEWLGLEVLYSKLLSSLNARVNFIAYYTINDKSYQLNEISQFELLEGRWYYTKDS